MKWPNDVVAPGRGKIGGLLSEAIYSHGELVGVVCGIGVNLTWPMDHDAVDESLSEATCIAALGNEAPALREFAEATIAEFDRLITTAEMEGVDEIVDRYRQHCVTIGQLVQVKTSGGALAGLFVEPGTDPGQQSVKNDRDKLVPTGDGAEVRPA